MQSHWNRSFDMALLVKMPGKVGCVRGGPEPVIEQTEGGGPTMRNPLYSRAFHCEMDMNNAYLDTQAGSGGTEAQDWANILLRMYLRWADKRGFGIRVARDRR